jgi:uncharacterized peroxidase-related enzyme
MKIDQSDAETNRSHTHGGDVMSWIRTIEEAEADGELARVYDGIARKRGKLSNIMKVQSLDPAAMEAHLELYMRLLFRKGGLSRAERELLAVVVSVENGCGYCTLHHAEALASWWKDRARVERVQDDPASADLSSREEALVRYAQRLTRSPSEVEESEVDGLREEGLTDEEILQANMIIGYFNFVNRVAEGLGVDAPPEEVEGYRY